MNHRIMIGMTLLSLGCLAVAAGEFLLAIEDKSDHSSPIVVELFTSQGCSSCPSADKLLKSISSDEILVLSFHVDYWNQLGWQDPFSSEQFTIRQRQYAGIFGLNQVYTPQMVVAGEMQFVGSNKKLANAALAKAKQSRISQTVRIHASKAEGNTLNIEYKTSNAGQSTLMNLAVAQKAGSSRVTSGENANENLTHVNVVRSFKSIPLDSNADGETQVSYPENLKLSELIVIGYLQDKLTGKIGASAKQTMK